MNSGLSPLERATNLITRLRMIHPRMELQTALMFMLIAQKKEISKPQLETLLNMPTASAYRNLKLLEGEKLIHIASSPSGSVVTITTAGERFAQSLFDTLGPTGEPEDGS
ncbi:hypothetical protein [Bosea sp. MMO-172]|uniref:hypothetical protein n=1 Tax=Bosea sp. MMO-172 TaxID=3127885 RepID=UPI0030173822